jgi:hypothetical protein
MQQVQQVTPILLGDLVEASNIFRRAAGVFKHLEEKILPPMQPRLPPERPPEATVSMAKIWATLCLAEAQVRRQKAFRGYSGSGFAACGSSVSMAKLWPICQQELRRVPLCRSI